jgi:hypothetical protein
MRGCRMALGEDRDRVLLVFWGRAWQLIAGNESLRAINQLFGVAMTLSDEWTEWHLTPSGWVSGTRDSAGLHPKQPPMDRVLTMLWRQNVASRGAEHDNESTELWRTTNNASVQKLLQKFGNPPHRLR